MVDERTPDPRTTPIGDYAEILRKHYSSARTTEKPRFRMSERNRKKLERIRAKVAQLRGGR